MAGLLRAGSATRTRGVQRRGAGRPSGSTTRGWISPSRGSARNRSAIADSKPSSGRQASSSRKNNRSPETSRTPAFRPAGMPRFSGSPSAAHPLGQIGRLPAVAHHHDVRGDSALGLQRGQPAREVGRPPSLGQDDHPVRRSQTLAPPSTSAVISPSYQPSRQPSPQPSAQPRRREHRDEVADDGHHGRHDQPDQQTLGGRTAEPQVEQCRQPGSVSTTRPSGRRGGTARSEPRCRSRRSRPPAGARTSSASGILGRPA